MKKYWLLFMQMLVFLKKDVLDLLRKTRRDATDAIGPRMTRFGYSIFFDTTGSEATRLRRSVISGEYEADDFWLFQKMVQKDDYAVDVGAHEGFVTMLLAQRVGSAGHVTACEPNPENVVFLKKNITINNFTNVEVIPKAIGKETAVKTFFFKKNFGAWGSLMNFWNDTDLQQSVPVTTLNSLLANRTAPVRFLKIDVEGNDFDVLLGAENILRQDKPHVSVEVNLSLWAVMHDSLNEMIEFLHNQGYHLFLLKGRSLVPYTWPDERVFNLFALHTSRIPEFAQHAALTLLS